MNIESLEIALDDAPIESVSARLNAPHSRSASDASSGEHPRHAILLAHGAGAPMDSPFMETLATGLAGPSTPVLRFNYAYSERMQRENKRRPPDRRPLLENVHRAALATLRERYPDHNVILAGKSMGGRLSSLLASEGVPCTALIFFGYPLHAPGRTEKLRSAHFEAIEQPTLFLQGSRDALCQLDLLRPELKRFRVPPKLHVIEDADHDFKVPKRSGRDRDDVLSELARTSRDWLGAL